MAKQADWSDDKRLPWVSCEPLDRYRAKKRGADLNLLKTFNYKYIFNKIREYLEAAASVYKLISLVKISPKKSFFLKNLKISRAKVKRFTRLKIVSNEAKISGLAGIRHYQIQKMLTPQPLSV